MAASLLGVNRFLTANGLNLGMLLAFAGLIGFGGAFISLLMSKMMAKWRPAPASSNRRQTSTEVWLVDTVARLAERPAADAGSRHLRRRAECLRHRRDKNSSLVAVSTGLLQSMTREEARPSWRTRSPHRQRRHGDADADPGRGEHLRRLPVAHRRLPGRLFLRRGEEPAGPGSATW
jgi:hypothetical protein